MVELYCERGMATEDAQAMVGALSKYDKFFVDVMLSEELGLPNYKVRLSSALRKRSCLKAPYVSVSGRRNDVVSHKFYDVVLYLKNAPCVVSQPLDEGESMKEGALMFASFALFGSVPLLPYCIMPAINDKSTLQDSFTCACVATGKLLDAPTLVSFFQHSASIDVQH